MVINDLPNVLTSSFDDFCTGSLLFCVKICLPVKVFECNKHIYLKQIVEIIKFFRLSLYSLIFDHQLPSCWCLIISCFCFLFIISLSLSIVKTGRERCKAVVGFFKYECSHSYCIYIKL